MTLVNCNLGGQKKVTVVHFKVLARVRKLTNLSQKLLPTQNSKPGTFITMLLLCHKLLKILYTKPKWTAFSKSQLKILAQRLMTELFHGCFQSLHIYV